MNAVLDWINSAGTGFVEFAGSMLVQSSVLIVILLLVDLLLRKKVRAVFRYCIWMLVLVKLVLPSSLSSPVSVGHWFGDELQSVKVSSISKTETAMPQPPKVVEQTRPVYTETASAAPATVSQATETEAISQPTEAASPVTWEGVVFLAWLAVVAAMVLLLFQRVVFVVGLVRQAKEAEGLMNDTLEFCRERMGVKSKVGLKVSPNATSPAVCGLFRPVILVPENLGASLGVGSLRAVLLHELAHIKRGDLWVNLIQTLLQIVYFYNPFVWLANAVIRRVREQAVDETVQVTMGEKAVEYPQTLVNVAKIAFKRPALSLRLIGVVESKSALTGRVKHMLDRPIPKSAKLGIIGLTAVLIIGAVLLPMAKAEKAIAQVEGDEEPVSMSIMADGIMKKLYSVQGWDEILTGVEIYGSRYGDSYSPDEKFKLWVCNENLNVIREFEFSYGLFKRGEPSEVQLKIEPTRVPVGYAVCLGFDSNKRKGVYVYYNKRTAVGEGKAGPRSYTGLPGQGFREFDNGEWRIKSLAAGVVIPDEFVGSWKGQVRISKDVPETRLPVKYDIGSNGDVTGKVGQAKIEGQLVNISKSHIQTEWMGISYGGRYAVYGELKGDIRGQGTDGTYFQSIFNLKDNRLVGQIGTIIKNQNGDNEPFVLDKMSLEKVIWNGQVNSRAVEKTEVRVKQTKADSGHDFVRLVVGTRRMAFEGQEITWEELPGILEEMPNREKTVFEIAITSKKIPFERFEDAKARAAKLVEQYGFAELSFVGVKPLRSKGGSEAGKKQSVAKAKKKPAEPSIIGKWESVDYVKEIEDFVPGEKSFPDDLFLKEVKFMRGGRTTSFFSWNRGWIVADDGKTRAQYHIKEIDGTTYLFLPWLSGDVTMRGRKPEYYVMVKAGAEKETAKLRTASSSSVPGVVSTSPAAFANDVSPSLKKLTVTFDQPMMDGSWSWTGGGDTFPERNGAISYDRTNKTCSMPVKLEPGKAYLVGINGPRHKNFQTVVGVPAQEYVIVFATKSIDGKPTEIPEDLLAYARKINSRSEQAEPAVSAKAAGLQSLIDSARVGDTVVIPKGVYTEPIEINKSLTLKGESRTDCIFEVTDNRPAIFIDTKGKGSVTVEGITIKWQLATSEKDIEYPVAVAVKDSKAEIRNCSFVPLGNFKRSPAAVKAVGFSELAVNRCRFEGFEYVVNYGEGTEGAVVNCLIMDCGHQGIMLYSDATVKIIRNVITGSKYHAIRSTGGELDMSDNLIIENANRGVYLGSKSARGSITNNIIMNNPTGIDGFAQSKVKIENNIIADSSYAGIGMRDTSNLLIRNNIFQGNERGWILFEGQGKGGNTSHRNTFWQNKVNAENFSKTADSILAEPGFVDAANGDFSLKSGPAVEHKQGLTNPEVLKVLWRRWQNRADKNVPFAGISSIKTDDGPADEVVDEKELGEIVEQAVLTISTCAENDPRVVKSLESLEGLDEQAVVKEVTKFLDSEKNTVKRAAMFVLWRGNFENIEPAAARLEKLCSHEEEQTRGMAALTLGGAKVESSFDTLCNMTLEDSSGYARRCGAYALGLLGKAEAKEVLEKALKDSDFNVRNNAEAAMTMLSLAAKESVSPEEKAVAAALAWLQLVDEGDYEKSWSQAAGFFKKAVSKEQFRNSVEPIRGPLGKVISRKVKSKQYTTSLPGAPDGEYVVIQFETSFENKKSAIETVIPMLDKDGRWRVSGYYIN